MNFLSIDIGTTAGKCQLFSDTGEILFYKANEYSLKIIDGYHYINLDNVKNTVFSLIKEASSVAKVDSIAISTLGESFALLDKDDNVLFDPMLFYDSRGMDQAEELTKMFSNEYMFKTIGAIPNPLFSISKLLWIKENNKAAYDKADKVLLMCDYIGYILTGERKIDYSLAARTGVFNVQKLEFATEILDKLGISVKMFSTPMPCGSVVGKIRAELATELGMNPDCVIVLGSHDQICQTLGAGVLNSGESADGMGTMECITAVTKGFPKDNGLGPLGYTVVPFAKKGLYCTYLTSYSANSAVNWFRKDILHGYTGEEKDFFAYMDTKLNTEPSKLLLLPYFAGASTPYLDPLATAAILGLTLTTDDAEIYKSILEGTSLEMYLNLKTISEHGFNKITETVATGGGSNSKYWLQIKSDITGMTIKTLRSSEGGLCGLAMLQSVALGKYSSLEEAKEIFVQYKSITTPEKDSSKYDEKKKLYLSLYPSIQRFIRKEK